jgi:putative ABC transport system permease protein
VVSQTAFAALLLIGAGLLLQTFSHLRAVDPGFRGDQVLALRTSLSPARYPDAARRAAFYSSVLERVQALPGVSDAGFTSWLPYTNWGGTTGFELEGRPNPAPGQQWDANLRLVTAGYLPAMGTTLAEGRFLSEFDREGSEPVAVVNRTLARKFWPGEGALNRRFRACDECPWMRIVGIAGDMRQKALDVDARPECFVPWRQLPQFLGFYPPQDLAIRVSGDPARIVPAVRRAVREADEAQPVSMLRVMSEYVEEELAPRRLQAQLVGGLAALALLLASIGVYGVLSYSVAERRSEIGVRLALGAEPRQVARLVAWQGVRPALAGLALGTAAAAAMARLAAGLLYGVAPRDPLTFAAAAAALLAVSIAACWIPARRAARSNPAVALRGE